MDRARNVDIQIATGWLFDSPRNTLLKDCRTGLPFLVGPSFELKTQNTAKLSTDTHVLDNGKIVEFSLTKPRDLKRQLIVKKSSLKKDNELIEEQKWFLSVSDIDIGKGQQYYLFSSDLAYCVLVYLEKTNSLDSVVKSVVRISLISLLSNEKGRCWVDFHHNIQCIRSKRKVTSLKVSLSNACVLCVLLNHENPKEKIVQVLKICHPNNSSITLNTQTSNLNRNSIEDDSEIDIYPIKQMRLSPILTFVRGLSFNSFGDKLIVRCAKDFSVCSTSTGFRDRCEPIQGSNPFVTYNVSLRMEILIRDSHLQLGSCIEIYEIKEVVIEGDGDGCKQLTYRLIWSVTAEEVGLSRVHVFQVQSFTDTLIFYNQFHTIHVLDPFKKKIVHQLDTRTCDSVTLGSCQSCIVNWSCQEVYVKFIVQSENCSFLKVFPLKSCSTLQSNTLVNLSAQKVLRTYSIKELGSLELPSVFHGKLGYF